jgi:hypothetical protein
MRKKFGKKFGDEREEGSVCSQKFFEKLHLQVLV